LLPDKKVEFNELVRGNKLRDGSQFRACPNSKCAAPEPGATASFVKPGITTLPRFKFALLKRPDGTLGVCAGAAIAADAVHTTAADKLASAT
jgi:hypothetical protein